MTLGIILELILLVQQLIEILVQLVPGMTQELIQLMSIQLVQGMITKLTHTFMMSSRYEIHS